MTKNQFSDDLILKIIASSKTINDAVERLGIPATTLRDFVRQQGYSGKEELSKSLEKEEYYGKPKKGVKTFFFTYAQNNTPVHNNFIKNLEKYASFLGNSNIFISKGTYKLRAMEDEDVFYDEAIEKYLTDKRINVFNRIVFCSDVDILPTSVNPLRGMEPYTHKSIGVFPHPKIALESIPTAKTSPLNMNITTGAVTIPNYDDTKSGHKGNFHHVFGALIVQIDKDGDVFWRQISADTDGNFQDLDVKVFNQNIMEHQRVSAITWGDIHVEVLDENVAKGSFFDTGNMLDILQPEYQFFHDVVDFTSRSHHNIHDPDFRHEMYLKGQEKVEDAFIKGANFLEKTMRKGCHSIVVASNHDDHLNRWLREASYKNDPVNAVFFLMCEYNKYKMRQYYGIFNFNVFEFALKKYSEKIHNIKFLDNDESFEVNGIEYGMHGHYGANGGRGSAISFAKAEPKCVVGHTHTARILQGVYQVGTSTKLDLRYNNGLSSWSNTHCVTYPNGKRTLITMVGKKWRPRY